jgi:hypothetical protein
MNFLEMRVSGGSMTKMLVRGCIEVEVGREGDAFSRKRQDSTKRKE